MLQAAKKYRIRPKPYLGQSFLRDESLLQREAAYAEIGPEDVVLEIGPGIGNLTQHLLRQAGQVVAIEQDRQFSPCLEALQKKCANLELIWGDALEVEWPRFDKVVANLPYRVALPLLFKLLEHRFDRAVLMVQKSLAGRLCARVGEKGYGRLSVAVGRRANVELVEVVGREAFWPEPEVQSALVKIERTRPKFEIPSEEFFKLVLEELFARRNQSVAQALGPIRHPELPAARLSAALERLSGKVRNKPVCRVTPTEFGQLARSLWEVRGKGRG
jgi:16S rRNA (adenine1518-N6/adenine1519-N6)-dimethyltransferase